MLNDLIKVARRLDSFGLTKEARLIRSIVKSANKNVSPKAHHFGLMARNRAQDEGRPFHTWELEYEDAVNAYEEANPEYFGEEEFSSEGKFSDDAWDDGSTEPYHFKNTEGDEEKARQKKSEDLIERYGRDDLSEERMGQIDERRWNEQYFGDPEGHAAVKYNPHSGRYYGGGSRS